MEIHIFAPQKADWVKFTGDYNPDNTSVAVRPSVCLPTWSQSRFESTAATNLEAHPTDTEV